MKNKRLEKILVVFFAIVLATMILITFARSSYFDDPLELPGYMRASEQDEKRPARDQQEAIQRRLDLAKGPMEAFSYGYVWSVSNSMGWGTQEYIDGVTSKEDWWHLVNFTKEAYDYRDTRFVECGKVPETLPNETLMEYLFERSASDIVKWAPEEEVVAAMNSYLESAAVEMDYYDLTPSSTRNC